MDSFLAKPCNRKIENQAKHKQMLNALHNFQDKIDSLSTTELIKDEAYIQLCNTNKELFEKFKCLFDEITEMKELYMDSIVNNVWTTSYTDANYHSRQLRTREYKMNSPSYVLCPCGDRICKDKKTRAGLFKFNPKAMITHQKTEKCMSNRARIKWKTDKKMKIHKVISIDTYLLMNSFMNKLYNEEQIKLSYKYSLCIMVRRRRINMLG